MKKVADLKFVYVEDNDIRDFMDEENIEILKKEYNLTISYKIGKTEIAGSLENLIKFNNNELELEDFTNYLYLKA